MHSSNPNKHMLSPRHMDLHLGILGSRKQKLVDEQKQILMSMHGKNQAIEAKKADDTLEADLETLELELKDLEAKADALEEKIVAQEELIEAYEDKVLDLTSDPSL